MRQTNRIMVVLLALLALFVFDPSLERGDDSKTPKERRGASAKKMKEHSEATEQEARELKAALDKQQRTIEEMTRAMDQMRAQMQSQMNELQSLKAGLDQSRATAEDANRKAEGMASLSAQVQSLATSKDELSKNFAAVKQSAEEAKKTSEVLAKGLNGFRFSGDFRYRYDLIARSSNQNDPSAVVKGNAIQNSRMRYRVRFNVDRTFDKYIDFHLQLSTGPLNNPLTNDQDFSGFTTKHLFTIAEAWMEAHNEKRTLVVQGGRLQEAFADNSRFLFDDDIRFNGFNEKYIHKIADQGVLKSIEFRAGQYIFTNPNIAIVTPGSPLASAGAAIGSIGRNSAMFHEGLVFNGDITSRLTQQFIADDQYYRNPNQIQLASTAAGFPVLINSTLGVVLSGPIAGSGNATTTPGGAIFTAPDFNIVRLAYRLDWKGLESHSRFPVAFIAQVGRNTGADFLRDAFLTSLTVGQSKEPGDWLFQYIWSIKDANSLISQVTDDDLGTGSGVNISTHLIRADYTIRKKLIFQNLLWIQNERRPSNPALLFFVPLQRGLPKTLRYQAQLLFNF